MSTVTRPAWATATRGTEFDDDVMHTVLIAVGDGVASGSSTHPPIAVSQFAYEDGSMGPVFADLDNVDIGDEGWDAPHCRNLAAALLEAAEIIEAASV